MMTRNRALNPTPSSLMIYVSNFTYIACTSFRRKAACGYNGKAPIACLYTAGMAQIGQFRPLLSPIPSKDG